MNQSNQPSALDLLLSRKSHHKLGGKPLRKEQLELLFKAAFRAPDHAQLRPWRYQVYSGKFLEQLAENCVQASLAQGKSNGVALDLQQQQKIRDKMKRAPTIILAYLSPKEHPKVPQIEQVLSLGASVQNLLNAAHFLGIGAIWRSGKLCFNPHLAARLGLQTHESLLGFIYLGQQEGCKRPVPQVDQEPLVSYFVEP